MNYTTTRRHTENRQHKLGIGRNRSKQLRDSGTTAALPTSRNLSHSRRPRSSLLVTVKRYWSSRNCVFAKREKRQRAVGSGNLLLHTGRHECAKFQCISNALGEKKHPQGPKVDPPSAVSVSTSVVSHIKQSGTVRIERKTRL